MGRSFIEEVELRHTRSLDPGLLALFLDAKYREVREGDRLCPGCISSVFVPEIRKQRDLYLAFLNYPETMRRSALRWFSLSRR